MGDGTGCDNMTAVIVKFRPDFKNVTDTIGNTEESGAKVNGKRSEPDDFVVTLALFSSFEFNFCFLYV